MDIHVDRVTVLDDPKGSVRAFVTVTFGELLTVRGFKVLETNGELWASFPREQGKDGKYYAIVKAADYDDDGNSSFADEVKSAILEAYNKEAGSSSSSSRQNSPSRRRGRTPARC